LCGCSQAFLRDFIETPTLAFELTQSHTKQDSPHIAVHLSRGENPFHDAVNVASARPKPVAVYARALKLRQLPVCVSGADQAEHLPANIAKILQVEQVDKCLAVEAG